MRNYFFIFLVLLSNKIHAATTEEIQGAAAGRYYGAIVLASEFSKTACGKTANLSEQLTNTNLAVKEIKNKFINIKSDEIEKAFSKSEELKHRQEMRELLGKMKLDKCDLAKQTLISFIEKEIQSWKILK